MMAYSATAQKDRHGLLIFSIVLLLSTVQSGEAQGDAFLQPSGEGEAWLSVSWTSTRNYYNTEGTTRIFDSVRTTFTNFTLGLSADYGLSDDLELNLELPIGYYTLTSGSRFPDRSIFAPAWLGIGVTYGRDFGGLRGAVSSLVRIPPGFHDGIYDDPNHPTFLSDGYFQLLNSLHIAYSGDEFWVKGSVGYNLRGEEPVDEIVYSAEAGVARVKGTGVFIGFAGVIATEDPSQPLRPFYAGASAEESLRQDGGIGRFATIDRETNFRLRPGGFVKINDHLSLSAQYQVMLFGINTLNLNTFNLAGGWRF
ncbi:MAG: hypothetical protein R3F28_09305 [Candidatus Kapaibacterium sp.]